MDTLAYIYKKYCLTPQNSSSPIKIDKSRWDIGFLLNELGCKKGVEVGAFKGVFTASLARKSPNTEVTGIDAWTVYKGYKDTDITSLESEAQTEAEHRASEIPNMKLKKAWSLDAAKTYNDGSLDFVYIDANHDYEHCKEDLEAWAKKVKSGGLVMGHDYVKNEKQNVGVIKAVDEWVKKYNISPLFIWADSTPSWMYVQK